MGRIFNIRNTGTLALINLTITNGYTNAFGGAITNQGTLYITSCTFSNNVANSNGGAISNSNGNVFINNSNFIDNSASDGGAIITSSSNSGNLNINNSIFTNNTGKSAGGAIYAYSNDYLEINNSLFINNKIENGTYGGGAIYTVSDMLINNSNFINNTATNNGGAIYVVDLSKISIINSNFINNTADSGGAIFALNEINMSIDNCSFSNNNAVDGGSITSYIQNDIKVINSNFINNTARSGGAIYNTWGSYLNITNSNFISNNADNRGGAILNSANLSLVGNLMFNNTANLGQMIYNNGIIGVLNLTYINNRTISVKNNTNVIVYAYLTDDMGNTITGRNITFYLNGILIDSIESLEGYAMLNYTIIGEKASFLLVNGTYAGIGTYPIIIKSGEFVIQSSSNYTINISKGKVGRPIICTGVVTDEDGNPLSNINIIIKINGNNYNVTTNANGEWSFVFTPTTSGNFNATISWAGNSTNEGFVDTVAYIIERIITNGNIVAPNGKVGKTTNISGILIDEDGNPIANAQVTVIIDGKSYTVTTDENGHWNLLYTPIRTGTIEISVKFAGNEIYTPYENNTTFNIETNNETNGNNKTNGNNTTNQTTTLESANNINNNPTANAAMKNTGISLISILFVLLSTLGLIVRKK